MRNIKDLKANERILCDNAEEWEIIKRLNNEDQNAMYDSDFPVYPGFGFSASIIYMELNGYTVYPASDYYEKKKSIEEQFEAWCARVDKLEKDFKEFSKNDVVAVATDYSAGKFFKETNSPTVAMSMGDVDELRFIGVVVSSNYANNFGIPKRFSKNSFTPIPNPFTGV